MSDCSCGFDVGDPRVARHADNCAMKRIAELERINRNYAVHEQELEAKLAKREAQIKALIQPLTDHYTNLAILQFMDVDDRLPSEQTDAARSS